MKSLVSLHIYDVHAAVNIEDDINPLLIFFSLGSIVVSVMDSHSCDRGSSPSQGKHIYVML